MIHPWKRALLEGASGVFERGGCKKPEIDEEQVKELHAKLGELAVANFFGTKAEALGREVRRGMIEPDHPDLSIGQHGRALVFLLHAQGRDRVKITHRSGLLAVPESHRNPKIKGSGA